MYGNGTGVRPRNMQMRMMNSAYEHTGQEVDRNRIFFSFGRNRNRNRSYISLRRLPLLNASHHHITRSTLHDGLAENNRTWNCRTKIQY